MRSPPVSRSRPGKTRTSDRWLLPPICTPAPLFEAGLVCEAFWRHALANERVGPKVVGWPYGPDPLMNHARRLLETTDSFGLSAARVTDNLNLAAQVFDDA